MPSEIHYCDGKLAVAMRLIVKVNLERREFSSDRIFNEDTGDRISMRTLAIVSKMVGRSTIEYGEIEQILLSCTIIDTNLLMD